MDLLYTINLFQTFFQSQPNQQILDPLCCLLRISLLQYKDSSTKISIIDNSLQYNQPGIFQGIIRNINGDKREDIHNIYQPILKAVQWYDISNPMFLYIFQKSLKGFDCLLKTYSKQSIIHTTLQHYRKLLNDTINRKEIDEMIEESKESPLINELENFWETEEINVIYKLLQLLDKQYNTIYIKNIEDILHMKEKKLYEFIKQSSCSYT
jgi:hypothetical protein